MISLKSGKIRENQENQEKSGKIRTDRKRGNQKKSGKIRKSEKIRTGRKRGNQGKSGKIRKNQEKSEQIRKNQEKSGKSGNVGIRRNQKKSRKSGNQKKSDDSILVCVHKRCLGNQEKSEKIRENQKKSVKS